MTPANFSILKACIQTDGYPHAPDPWRAALLRALDSQDLSAVARTSKPSFQWLLEEAPEAVLRVPVRATTADQGRTAARCSVVKEQLAGRGPDLPTVVALVQRGEIAATDQWWTEVFKALASGVFAERPGLRAKSISQTIHTGITGLLHISKLVATGITGQGPAQTECSAPPSALRKLLTTQQAQH